MGRRRYTAEQIIDKLREAEVETAKGMSIVQVSKKLEISEQKIPVFAFASLQLPQRRGFFAGESFRRYYKNKN